MNVEPLEERYRSFGWEVIVCDGHDMPQVVDALQNAKKIPVAGKPTVVIANTVKGKGVSFMENVAGWHGKAPNYDEMVKALDELGLKQTHRLRRAAEESKRVSEGQWKPRLMPRCRSSPATTGGTAVHR